MIQTPFNRNWWLSTALVVVISVALPVSGSAQQPPVIVTQPQDVSVASGEDAVFSVAATGTPPLSYQWRFQGADLAGETNDTLQLTQVRLTQGGAYAVKVENMAGSVVSTNAQLKIDEDLTFRIIDFLTNGAMVAEHNNVTGDDRGGIAVSSTMVFVTGDTTTGRFRRTDLGGGTAVGTQYDALVSDLRTETVYSLGNGSQPLAYGGGRLDGLLEINGATGTFTGRRIPLSTSINVTFNTGIFSGYNRIVIATGNRAYNIDLPSGEVTDLGQSSFFNHTFSESWAYWGLAEYFGGSIFMVYVQDQNTIVRTRLPDGPTTTVSSFSNLSDMASISFSTSLSRWFFHFEGFSELGSGDELVGSAKAYFTTNPDYPAITQEPISRTVYPGTNLTLSVAVSGAGPFEYQWFFNGAPIDGANDASLDLTDLEPPDTGDYSVEVSNAIGSVRSGNAFIRIITVPEIYQPPQGISVLPGTNVILRVFGDGAPPVSYQWRLNGMDLPDATNSTLTLQNVQTNQTGNYSVRLSNSYGSTNSPNALLTVVVYEDDGRVFRIESLDTTGSAVVDHNNITGDDRGGIAASTTQVFYTGDSATGRFNLDNLGGGTSLGSVYDSLVSNLRTEKVYSLANGGTPIGFNRGTITALLEHDDLGALTGKQIVLSPPIVLSQFGDTGLFSGYDEIIIYDNANVYRIALPAGKVTELGVMPRFNHAYTENWAFWGVAEHFGGAVYLDYVQNSTTIARARVPLGDITTLASFSNLSDMACFTVSIPRDRWYFHHEYNSQFGGDPSGETLGYASAAFTIDSGSGADHFGWSPIANGQMADTPLSVRLSALNTDGQVVTNFAGVVHISASNADGTPLEISPTTVTNFVNGVWDGIVTLAEPGFGVQLRAEDASGNFGLSAPFSMTVEDDLALLVSAVPDPVGVRETLTYTIVVTNTGPNLSTGVIVTNALPSGSTLVNVTTTQGNFFNAAGTMLFNIGSLAGGASATIQIFLTYPAEGLITDTVSAGRIQQDPFPGNNRVDSVARVEFPRIFINDATVTEGDSGTNAVFHLTLSTPSSQPVTVGYGTAGVTAIAGIDFTPHSGVFTFAPGTTNQDLVIPVLGDDLYESEETFNVLLSNVSNATLARAQATGTILDDDPAPTVAIQDVTVVEGNGSPVNATFTVQLSFQAGTPIGFDYNTANGTALGGSDFQPRSGRITFQPGSSLSQIINVPIIGDTRAENDETFYVYLSNPGNISLTATQAVGTILNDDGVGVLDHFEWSTLGAQTVQQAFPVVITAKDFFGTTMTNFTGPVALRGIQITNFETHPMIGDLTPENSDSGDFTIGFAFTPNQDISVTAVRHISGTIIKIWTEDGAEISSTSVASTPGTWVETPLDTPVALQAGTRYLVSFYTGGGALYFVSTAPTTFPNGTIDGAYFTTGNGFPDQSVGGPLLLVDLRYEIIRSREISVAPTNTTPFTDGVWTGEVTVPDLATNLLLEADDGQGHTGRSNPLAIVAPSGSIIPQVGPPFTPAGPNRGEIDRNDTAEVVPGSGATSTGTGLRRASNLNTLRIDGIDQTGGWLRIRFTGFPGRHYQLERMTPSGNSGWAPVTDVWVEREPSVQITLPCPGNVNACFFRLRLLE